MAGTIAILQARMSSTRLPGKVLRPLFGQPTLARQVERIRRATTVDRLIVATSDDPRDEPIADLCRRIKVDCFRGTLADVLDRFYHAAAPWQPSDVVRLTADCPLADWTLIDRVVTTHRSGGFAYTSNVRPPTYPDGLDVEVVSFAALEAAHREAKENVEREHVTPFVWRRPDVFRCHNIVADQDLSFHRWTIDHPVDLELIEAIYAALYPSNSAFTTTDVLAFLEENPALFALNQSLARPRKSAPAV